MKKSVVMAGIKMTPVEEVTRAVCFFKDEKLECTFCTDELIEGCRVVLIGGGPEEPGKAADFVLFMYPKEGKADARDKV